MPELALCISRPQCRTACSCGSLCPCESLAICGQKKGFWLQDPQDPKRSEGRYERPSKTPADHQASGRPRLHPHIGRASPPAVRQPSPAVACSSWCARLGAKHVMQALLLVGEDNGCFCGEMSMLLAMKWPGGPGKGSEGGRMPRTCLGRASRQGNSRLWSERWGRQPGHSMARPIRLGPRDANLDPGCSAHACTAEVRSACKPISRYMVSLAAALLSARAPSHLSQPPTTTHNFGVFYCTRCYCCMCGYRTGHCSWRVATILKTSGTTPPRSKGCNAHTQCKHHASRVCACSHPRKRPACTASCQHPAKRMS